MNRAILAYEFGVEIYVLLIILGILALIILSILGKFFSLWFQAYVSGTPIPLFNLIGMSLRKIPPASLSMPGSTSLRRD